MTKNLLKKILYATLPLMMLAPQANASMVGGYTIDFTFSNLHTSDGSAGPNEVNGRIAFTAYSAVPHDAGWYWMDVNHSIIIDGQLAFDEHNVTRARLLLDDNDNMLGIDLRSWETEFTDGHFQVTFLDIINQSGFPTEAPECSDQVIGLRYKLDGVTYDSCGDVEFSVVAMKRPTKPQQVLQVRDPAPDPFATTEVPAPAGMALLGLGLIGLAWRRRV